MAMLLVTMVIVYFIYFAKVSDNKGGLQIMVDQSQRMKVELTRVNMISVAREIQSFGAGEEGGLPSDLDALKRSRRLGTGLLDSWGHEIRYQRLSEGSFRLRSAGPDGVFETPDDIVKDF
jgi:hypothetical protein